MWSGDDLGGERARETGWKPRTTVAVATKKMDRTTFMAAAAGSWVARAVLMKQQKGSGKTKRR
jgi:hypothetical protein